MKIIELVRLIIKHIKLLIIVPILLALLVLILTNKPQFEYASQTILYTGIASGSSIEMDKTFNYYATNTAFDNLINIINSRETQEEVAIRLLSQHLMLPKANPKYISSKYFDELKEKIPAELYDYVDKTDYLNSQNNDSIVIYNDALSLFPIEINRANYEKTVQNLTALMKSNTLNYVYELLNYEDEHYSIQAISKIQAIRIASSDLVKLSYNANDPGICQQTLAIYNEVCIKNYKNIKENRSDAVVKYFESQLELANEKLKNAEDKLLEFNKSYNIINYYEQSKAVAVVKEDMEVVYNNKKAQLAGTQAATKKLEEKLNIQEHIQLKNSSVLEKKKQLGDINFKLAILQSDAESNNDVNSRSKIYELKKQSEILTDEIKKSVGDLYTYQNTIEGVPVSKVLPDWMNNVVATENLKAEINVMDQRNKVFQEQYEIYAPAGANIKRIEREISVSEQGYLEILHGLNLAKLKLQDNELSSNLKAIDPPFYPLTPIPTKRKLLIIAAALLGAILIFGAIIIMEYFDDTLKNSNKASKILNLPALGMMPKILLNPGTINLPFVQDRLVEIMGQNIVQFFGSNNTNNAVKTILFFSTQQMEGKTVLAANIAKTLKRSGKKVLVLNYNRNQQPLKEQRKLPVLNRLLGYQDPRIDFNNPFLRDASSQLEPTEYQIYSINEQFYKVKSYIDIIEQNQIKLDFTPDYVIIELPALIYNNIPTELMAQADLDILVCRSNRAWSEADQAALNHILHISESKLKFIINGVDLNETESVLGDLPKKRSVFRKKVKNMFRFQFFSKNQI
jgi:polysaccharide biosynthesis transport protein